MQTKKIAIVSLFGLIVIGFGLWMAYKQQTITRVEQSTETQEPRLVVAATIQPLYDIVRQVAGEYIEVKRILPPGSSPHTFDPTPKDIKNLEQAKIIFAIGQGLDSWTQDVQQAVVGSVVKTVESGISLKQQIPHQHELEQEDGHSQEEEDLEHGSVDPHYWLDPDNAIVIAYTVAQQLAELDPDHAIEFSQQADLFAMNVRAQDVQLTSLIQTMSNKHIVTFHDAFGYFADHYGLEVVATFEPFPGKEPTPQYLQHIEEELVEHQISAVYMEPQLSTDSLEAFAHDHGVSIGILDPEGSFGGETDYMSMIQRNVETIVRTNK